jgi:outer membrane protein assembly factor BamC
VSLIAKVFRMHVTKLPAYGRALLGLVAAATAAMLLAGCSTTDSMGKKIDYKSTSSAPALELPPDLTTPEYDDRYNVATASGLAARSATRPKTGDEIAPNANADARIMRSGNERWLVVRATPEQAWNVSRQFWQDNGFVLAVEQPTVGVMETDWAENRADMPVDFVQKTIGKVADVFMSTYKRDKFRTRIERGTEAGTVDIFISHRGAEQVPTAKIDNSSPTAFIWAATPVNPGLEAEFLTRLMVRFGTPEPAAAQAVAAAQPGRPGPDRARLEKAADGAMQLQVDDTFDRSWRRVGLALDRIGFTVVDRDRSKGVYFVRFGDPDAGTGKTDESWLTKLAFWKDSTEKPEQYRIVVAEGGGAPRSVVTIQGPAGEPNRSPNGEKILALLQEQLK